MPYPLSKASPARMATPQQSLQPWVIDETAISIFLTKLIKELNAIIYKTTIQ